MAYTNTELADDYFRVAKRFISPGDAKSTAQRIAACDIDLPSYYWACHTFDNHPSETGPTSREIMELVLLFGVDRARKYMSYLTDVETVYKRKPVHHGDQISGNDDKLPMLYDAIKHIEDGH